jgi:DNA-binding transcriptional ArsR family regulator
MYRSAVSAASSQNVLIFAALADPTRFALLERLRLGERRVGELCEETKLAQSLISFHLKALREAGLLRSRKQGRTIWYSIDPAGRARLRRLVESLGAEAREGGEAARAADLELCLEYINGR